ncbi:unnamed protein product [Acanthoscelides obtectus]|uniref:MADF domain-containing protein n=1 Tax=Acanthoscelides obtectus TaxID=200917 RepID=A0A9P0K5T4_ACAOB|nr:unnamed protein product [Acanthoscelides obtectus]CAK1669677.1 hypothetical protein AOBTE_LOCUS27162 [Acanthoscelides obtectus]
MESADVVQDVDIDILISLVEARPVIWDKTRDVYKDRNDTRNAWKEIFLELRPDFEELEATEKTALVSKKVMKKWTNVRDTFKKSMKKQKSASRSGAGATTIKAYIYNDHLKFLNKILTDRKTENSLKSNTSQSDKSDEEEETLETNMPEDNALNNKVAKTGPPKKRKMDSVELEMMKALKETPDRHLCFFFKA